MIMAALVLARFLRSCHSSVEIVYALAFLTFGLSDFREAYSLTSWLIWLKAANLAPASLAPLVRHHTLLPAEQAVLNCVVSSRLPATSLGSLACKLSNCEH